jgi:hypothetical protein
MAIAEAAEAAADNTAVQAGLWRRNAWNLNEFGEA